MHLDVSVHWDVRDLCVLLLCRVLEVLTGIAEGREKLDLKRFSSIIKRKIKNVLNQVSKIIILEPSTCSVPSVRFTFCVCVHVSN